MSAVPSNVLPQIFLGIINLVAVSALPAKAAEIILAEKFPELSR